MSRSLEQKRAAHQQYKQDVKERGKPFHPYAMFHDTVIGLVVVTVIVALACIWKFTAEEGRTPPAGWARSTRTRPTPGRRASSRGPTGTSTSSSISSGSSSGRTRSCWARSGSHHRALLLLAIPFIDLRRERRLLRRRSRWSSRSSSTVLSMGVLTYKGATAEENAASQAEGLVPEVDRECQPAGGSAGGSRAVPRSPAASTATYLGAGSPNLGAPDLSEEGTQGRSVDFLTRYIANPREFGNNVMPVYESLGEENVRAMAVFLEASEGEQ